MGLHFGTYKIWLVNQASFKYCKTIIQMFNHSVNNSLYIFVSLQLFNIQTRYINHSWLFLSLHRVWYGIQPLETVKFSNLKRELEGKFYCRKWIIPNCTRFCGVFVSLMIFRRFADRLFHRFRLICKKICTNY